MRRKLQTLSGGVLAALGLMAGSAYAQGDRGDFVLDVGTRQPGAGATLEFAVSYRNPDDPNAKPPSITSAVFRLPEGTRIDTSAVERCTASDDQIRAAGPSACPAASRVGSGTLTAITGVGAPADPVAGDVTVFNGDRQLIEVVTVPGTEQTAGLDRLTVDGNTLTAHPPDTPGGPPDGRTAVKDINLTIDRRGYATAPADCGAGGWDYGASFEFSDGGKHEVAHRLPCRAARPALALTARPARVAVGRRITVRFAVRSASAACRGRAKVRFAGRRAWTDASGRAQISATLRAARRYPVSVSKRGCRTARGVVTAVR